VKTLFSSLRGGFFSPLGIKANPLGRTRVEKLASAHFYQKIWQLFLFLKTFWREKFAKF
jgi:hypothetical protein